MRQHSCWGILWFFKRPQVRPLEKQRNQHHDIWCLITNIQADRIATFSSVITMIFDPCIGRSRLNLLFICSVNLCLFIHCQFYCSSVVRSASFCLTCFVKLFSVWFFNYSVYFEVLILELYSRYFDPHNNNHPAVNKHNTPECTIFVLV
jgi:hypothetical protein